ncbi:MAG: 4Fe-4S binding protein, partial [Rhodomicrobium sp.]
FVAYAGLLLAAAMVMFKPYCRFLCPLGAALAAGGRARLLDWIRRRPECGTPCKLCAHCCRYNAIQPKGAIRYDECFQCLDCVKIYDNEGQCVPLVLEVKGRNRAQTARGRAEGV